MTQKKVWQYRCDFCGKKKYSAGHMKSHELSCTMNPNRTCQAHKYIEDQSQVPMDELVSVLTLDGTDGGLEELRKLTGNCPMCILAAIRQFRIKNKEAYDAVDFINGTREFNFDFKAELSKFWQDQNDARADCPE